MDSLLVLCHPESRSLCASAAGEIRHYLETGPALTGGVCHFLDLYQEDFSPILSGAEHQRRFSFDEVIRKHSRALESADLLVFVHPEWWGGPPALLKGWLDRVLRPGVAYEYLGEEFEDKVKTPLLTGKKALVALTTDAPPPAPGSTHPLARLWQEDILGFCGVAPVEVRILHETWQSSYAQRQDWIRSLVEALQKLQVAP